MALTVGVALALAVGLFATLLRLDRERGFYPTVTMVVASYYVLFAVMAGDTHALWLEVLAAGAFVVAAALGFRRSLWIVVAALAAHGVQDFFHGAVIENPGVPAWWPQFCGAYDVTAAAYLAWRLGATHGRSGLRGARSPC